MTHEAGQRPFYNESAFSNRDSKPKPKRRARQFKGFITSADFIESMQPPDYLTDGLLLRGSTYTLTGNTGHCKTLIAILLAIRVATGGWFCGKKCEPSSVIFFAGENADNVKVQFYAMCNELGVDWAELQIIWHPGVFDLNEAREVIMYRMGEYDDLGLIVYDSLQAFNVGDDDNANMQMLDLAVNFRALSEFHPGRPANLILAHPVKNASRDNLLPRGGSALTNELDGNLTAWLDGNELTLHWLGKLRGIPFDPIKLEQAIIKPEGLVDSKGYQMSATIVRQMAESRATEIKTEQNRIEIAVLAAIAAESGLSERELAVKAQTTKTTAHRTLERLTEKKWLRNYSGKHMLTKEGKIALALATADDGPRGGPEVDRSSNFGPPL